MKDALLVAVPHSIQQLAEHAARRGLLRGGGGGGSAGRVAQLRTENPQRSAWLPTLPCRLLLPISQTDARPPASHPAGSPSLLRTFMGPSATTLSNSSPPVTSSITMKILSRLDITSSRLTMWGWRIWGRRGRQA